MSLRVRRDAALIQLQCRECQESLWVPPTKSDPDGTVTVHCLCPNCFGSGRDFSVRYFDAAGNELVSKTLCKWQALPQN
jgi:hypothetical protein